MGHVDAFPRPRLSARCRFSQGTFAGTRGNGRDAPIPDLPALGPERRSFDPKADGLISRKMTANGVGCHYFANDKAVHDRVEMKSSLIEHATAYSMRA
jgi:hypothetical protein